MSPSSSRLARSPARVGDDAKGQHPQVDRTRVEVKIKQSSCRKHDCSPNKLGEVVHPQGSSFAKNAQQAHPPRPEASTQSLDKRVAVRFLLPKSRVRDDPDPKVINQLVGEETGKREDEQILNVVNKLVDRYYAD